MNCSKPSESVERYLSRVQRPTEGTAWYTRLQGCHPCHRCHPGVFTKKAWMILKKVSVTTLTTVTTLIILSRLVLRAKMCWRSRMDASTLLTTLTDLGVSVSSDGV